MLSKYLTCNENHFGLTVIKKKEKKKSISAQNKLYSFPLYVGPNVTLSSRAVLLNELLINCSYLIITNCNNEDNSSVFSTAFLISYTLCPKTLSLSVCIKRVIESGKRLVLRFYCVYIFTVDK